MFFELETPVFEILLIAIVGLTPSILSLWLMRRAKLQAQARLQAISQSMASPRLWNTHLPQLETFQDSYYIEGVGHVIGDISCQYNCKSAYLRCAVHPCATSCENCRDYSPTTLDYTDKLPSSS